MKKNINCLNCGYVIAIIEFQENEKSIKTNYKIRSNKVIVKDNQINAIIKCKCSNSNAIIINENSYIQEFAKMKIN